MALHRVRRLVFVLVLLAASSALPASASAAFPGKNGRIAYFAYPYNNTNGQIVAANPDGSNPVSLAFAQEGIFVADPEWSPDGSRIVFTRENNAGAGYAAFVVNQDGSGLAPVTPPAYEDFGAAWTPDGRIVVARLDRSLSLFCHSLVVMNADGSSPHTVLAPQEGPCFKDSPEWSPKGDKIAFVGAADDQASIEGGESIYTVGADGTGVRALPSVSGSDGPAWSPDGTQLAYTIHFSVTPSRESGGALVLSNADGSGARTIAIGVYDPAWSPDGTALAVAVGTFGASDIVTYDTFGTKLGDVTQDGPQSIANSYPNWQPIPGPKRSDYKNAAQFCNAERDFLGDAAFKRKYGANGNGANAFGRCVSSSQVFLAR